MMATSKLAQTARGSQRCTACGRVKDLSAFGIHGRWGTPMKKCLSCMADIRRHAGAKKAKTAAKAREKAAAQTVRQVKKEARVKASAEVLWARLDGYAMAVNDDGALAGLLAELKSVVTIRIEDVS